MKRIFIIISLVSCLTTWSQDYLGIYGSTRAPVNTRWLNPATIVDSRAFVDFQLAGASVFAHNNFVSVSGRDFNAYGLTHDPQISFNRDRAPYRAAVTAAIHGPALSFAIRQHAFALHVSARVAASVNGVPRSLGYYITEGFQYREQMGQMQQVRNLRVNALSWVEYGLSYGTIIGRSGDGLTLAAATLKKLDGIAAAGARLDEWNYMVTDSNHMQTYSVHGEYGFNEPAFRSGKGWSTDLGISFKRLNRSASDYTPFSPCTDGGYRYRWGFSIIDAGMVSFRGNAYRNRFNQSEEHQWSNFQDTRLDDVADLDSLINTGFNLSQQNADNQRFRMMLPAGLSAQVDYNLGRGFYCFGAVMYGLPWKNRLGVQRASWVTAVPRFERKRFEVALPLSLMEFSQPRMGLMLRLNSIIIGTDHLAPWLFNSPVYGADVYVCIKYTGFRHWKCRDKKSKTSAHSVKGGRWQPCPEW